MKKNKEEGMFVFLGYYDAIKTIPRDADKWKMFDAIFNYRMWGTLPDAKLAKHPIFVLTRSMVDGKKKYGGDSNEQKTKSNSKATRQIYTPDLEAINKAFGDTVPSDGVGADNKNKNLIKNNNKNKNTQKEILKEKVQKQYVCSNGKYIPYERYLKNKEKDANSLVEYRGTLIPKDMFDNRFFDNLDDIEI